MVPVRFFRLFAMLETNFSRIKQEMTLYNSVLIRGAQKTCLTKVKFIKNEKHAKNTFFFKKNDAMTYNRFFKTGFKTVFLPWKKKSESLFAVLLINIMKNLNMFLLYFY